MRRRYPCGPGRMPRSGSRMPREVAGRPGGTARRRNRMTAPEGQTARDIYPEDNGIPDVSQDDSPTIYENEDPEFAPEPGERPTATVDYGTTAFEQAEGESLEGRLAREVPDDAPAMRPAA